MPGDLALIGPPPKLGSVNVIDPAFFNEVSQFAHTGIAGLVYLVIGHVAQTMGLFHWWWFATLAGVGVALAGWKEGYWDPRHENAATRGSGLQDFSFYILGIGIAVVAILL
jgi:hypothetical protein